MTMQFYWIQIAQQKARFDSEAKDEDEFKAFMDGETNNYSQDVDVYMYEAYQDERLDIIKELRK